MFFRKNHQVVSKHSVLTKNAFLKRYQVSINLLSWLRVLVSVYFDYFFLVVRSYKLSHPISVLNPDPPHKLWLIQNNVVTKGHAIRPAFLAALDKTRT